MDYRQFEIDKPEKKKPFIRFEKIILFENDQVVVVNKPEGISSLSDRDEEINMLRLGRNYNPDLKLCHRLDKQTTGVLVFAKGADNYREIAMQFEARDVIKHYVALIHGAREFDEFVIDAPIFPGSKGKARVDYQTGKESVTVVSTAEMYRDFTLVDVHPLTGRMHQIRVHLSSVGCPLVGDELYGGHDIFLSEFKKNYKFNRKLEEAPINEGFFLHARGIRLTVPGDEEESTFIAPLPKKFETALKILGKYNHT